MFLLILLFSELFHSFGHFFVFSRLYLPSNRWLESHLIYFIWDAISAFSSFLYLTFYYKYSIPIYYELIHIILHLYYVITWNKSKNAIKIRNWSSREYRGPLITIDYFLTLYDILIHLYYSYYLFYTLKYLYL